MSLIALQLNIIIIIIEFYNRAQYTYSLDPSKWEKALNTALVVLPRLRITDHNLRFGARVAMCRIQPSQSHPHTDT